MEKEKQPWIIYIQGQFTSTEQYRETEQALFLFFLYSLIPRIYSASKWVNSALQAALENSEKLLVILTILSDLLLAVDEREIFIFAVWVQVCNIFLYSWQNSVYVVVDMFS